MASERYYTWNPALHFEVLRGGLLSEELRKRTLSLTYTDRDIKYDQLDWELDNRDGLLTRPEYLAAGLTIRMRLGYLNDTTAWKSFIVTQVEGGVGVWNRQNPPVGDEEGKIKFTARNRNAKVPKGKKGKRARPTSDITQYDLLLSPPNGSKRFPGAGQTSDAVREIAQICGFTSDYMLIEDTEDSLEDGTALLDGETYGDFIFRHAERFGYSYKIDHRGFHFHSARWVKDNRTRIREVFTYAADNDSLSLRLVGDFSLPLPSSVVVSAYDPMTRAITTSTVTGDDGKVNRQISYLDFGRRGLPGHQERVANLTEVVRVMGTAGMATPKAIATFTRRHDRAFKVELKVVGNPKVLATDMIEIGGTNNPLVDGEWYIPVAKHIFEGETYVSEFDCKHPAKHKKAKMRVTPLTLSKIIQSGKSPAEIARAVVYLTGIRNR